MGKSLPSPLWHRAVLIDTFRMARPGPNSPAPPQNCYHSAISQDKMTIAANAMVDKSRGVSLLEMGYEK